MKEVIVGGRRLRLDPARAIGTGGEADVYDIGSGRALKVYKGPDHPDYRGFPDEQRAARERLRTRAAKLRDFPAMLPPRVVAPLETATDRSGALAGYSMRLVPNAEPLLRWSEPSFRRAVPPAAVAPLFLDLHSTVARIHEAGVVIGDFNDLNVLVSGQSAHLIDADSFQFGAHQCLAYTERFVDPLCCGAAVAAPSWALSGSTLAPMGGASLSPVRPYTPASDWYAFEVMLFQSLLLVHPYGGVLPGPSGRSCERTLRRITVLDPAVRYPKASIPWQALPDDILHRFHAAFVKDERGAFPMGLLESLRWTRCGSCQRLHARDFCPVCAGPAPAVRRALVTVRGRVTAVRLLQTSGEVVAVGPEGWLVYEGGEFRREDKSLAWRGPLRPGTRYFLNGRATVAVGRDEAYSCAAGRAWWERDGALWREGPLGDERVGEVLSGQTRLWAGPKFGFGYYRAGGVMVAFVFDAARRGIADGVRLPAIRGRILDADCFFGEGRAWLLLSIESNGQVLRRCTVIREDGRVSASADSPAWLESIHGACAAGPFLFVPTDKGIIRVEDSLSAATEFTETEPFVDAESLLAAAGDGLIVASRHEIVKLSIKSEVLP